MYMYVWNVKRYQLIRGETITSDCLYWPTHTGLIYYTKNLTANVSTEIKQMIDHWAVDEVLV
jgi:hypothetical protein